MAGKTLYHSELSKMGPVRVTVASDILKSKYSKPDAPKPDYVMLKFADGSERSYNLENPGCGSVFSGKKGSTFTIVAEGTRDGATITYVGQPGDTAPPARQAPPAAAAAPQVGAAPAPAQHAPPDKAVSAAKVFIAKRLTLQKMTLAATHALSMDWQKKHGEAMPLELFQSINATLFIAADRGLNVSDLPCGFDYATGQATHKAGAAPAAAAAAPPPPKPKCPTHGSELAADGTCAECQAEIAAADDNVPF